MDDTWNDGYLEYGRFRVSLYGPHDAAASWETSMPKCFKNIILNAGLRVRAHSTQRKTGIRIVVHGNAFMTGGPRDQLECLKIITKKHFETKHIMMGQSSDLWMSWVLLNRKIVWQDNGIENIPDNWHCERVVEALNLHHAKTVTTPAVKEIEN